MVIHIKGEIAGLAVNEKSSGNIRLVIAEHRGYFKTDGCIEIIFDKKATKDLREHIGEQLPPKSVDATLEWKITHKTIDIIIDC